MKSLVESLFDKDLATKNPIDEIIDHLDIKKYSNKTTEQALDTLFTIGGKRYGFFSAGSKKEEFVKAIRKNDWMMLARKNHDGDDNYAVVLPYEKDNGYLARYYWWPGDWFEDDISIGWSSASDFGSREIFIRLRNIGYEECILITDKKIKDALKKRLKELCK